MSDSQQKQDLRKQQLTLLKYEKTIKSGALVLGAGGAVAAANADKVLGGKAARRSPSSATPIWRLHKKRLRRMTS